MQYGPSILVAAVSGALGGVFGGFATEWMRPRPHPIEVKAATADFAPSGEELRDLSDKVASLEAKLLRMDQRRKLAALTPGPGASNNAPSEAPRDRNVADDPVFEAAVRDVMDRMQQERSKERDERRDQAVQRWADQIGDKLQLTDKQQTSVLAVAQGITQKMRDMRESAAEPGAAPGPSWIEQRTALLAQGEQRIAEVLSPQQLQTYKDTSDIQLESILRGGFRGRGGP